MTTGSIPGARTTTDEPSRRRQGPPSSTTFTCRLTCCAKGARTELDASCARARGRSYGLRCPPAAKLACLSDVHAVACARRHRLCSMHPWQPSGAHVWTAACSPCTENICSWRAFMCSLDRGTSAAPTAPGMGAAVAAKGRSDGRRPIRSQDPASRQHAVSPPRRAFRVTPTDPCLVPARCCPCCGGFFFL